MPPIRPTITDAEFKLFIVLWNQRMGQSTPQIHLDMAQWLEGRWRAGDKHLLLMAFRSAGKSTMTGLFAAWLLYRNPDLRILVLAADLALAKKMVRNVKRIIEAHPLTPHLKPDRADQWASDRFTVKRMMELRDPSMLARGITANITGSRADIIICDDVEVPSTCDSAEKRQNLRERLSEMTYVLMEGGTQIYVGTPHNYYTIYADQPRTEIGEERAFLSGFKALKIPILDAQGNSAWEERYGTAEIQRMKRASGPNKFTSQMMLRPANIAEGRLDPDRLQIYEESLDYTKELQSLFIGDNKMLSASAFWDPAFGSIKGDGSVLAIIFADDAGNFYLHHLSYIKTNQNEQADEATQQCQAIARIAKAHYLPSLTVETNGIGKFLPNILRNELARAKAPCTVKEISQSRSKDLRILEAFDTVLAANRLFIHKNVLKTRFMMEMREWRPSESGKGSSRHHDDGLDAVAGALAQQPDRLKRLHKVGAHQWMVGANAHKAKSDFDV